MKMLDYEIIKTKGLWEVWIPDESGALIGSGVAKATALRDASERLRNAANMMQGELEAMT